jgi:hypothetical protein
MAITILSSSHLPAEGRQQSRNKAGKPIQKVAKVTTTGAAEINSIFPLFSIPLNAVITSLVVASTDHGTTGDLDIGFFPNTKAIHDEIEADTIVVGDAVDKDALVQNLDINAAAVAPTECRFQVKAITTAEQTAYELSGLTSVPAYDEFLVVASLPEATTAAGTVVVRIEYLV